MNYISDIRDFISNDRVVSYRWLANTLNIHVNESKKLLEEYKLKNSDLVAMYCICGYTNNKSLKFYIVEENKINSVKSKFESITNEHIYSIQGFKSEMTTTLLKTTDHDQAKELLMQTPNCDSFLKNKIGGIQLEEAKVESVGVRQISSNEFVAVGVKDVETAEQHLQRIFANRSTPQPVKSKATANAASFFGKTNPSSSSSSTKGTNDDKDKYNKEKKISSKGDDNDDEMDWLNELEDEKEKKDIAITDKKKQVRKIIVDNSDDEWDDGSIPKPSSNDKDSAIKDKKRKSIEKTSKDKNNDQIIDNDNDNDNENNNDIKVAAKKSKAFVRGPMDDYKEDIDIEQHKALQEILASNGVPQKKMKRVLVEKTTLDDKGFSVTTNVYENVTDDEKEVVKKPTSQQQLNTTKIVPKSVAAKKTGDAVSKQKSNMMSFFGAPKK